jgi:hypothetical protein
MTHSYHFGFTRMIQPPDTAFHRMGRRKAGMLPTSGLGNNISLEVSARQVYVEAAKHISTSYIERKNLSVRMTNRRFTRLTNAFSKSLTNHMAAVALGYLAYNFIKIHRTLRVTPAMAASVTDRLWDAEDLVAAWEASERRAERQAA